MTTIRSMTLASPRAVAAALVAFALLAAGCGTAADELTDTDPTAADAAEDDLAPDDADTPDEDAPVDPDPQDAPDPGPDGDDAGVDDRPEPPPPAAAPATKPVAKPAAKPVAKPAAKPATKPAVAPSPLPDGRHQGRLVAIDARTVTVDLIQVLSGDAAIAAAKAAGVPLDDDGTLPNDVFVKDLGRRVVVPVAGDGGFQIYDCSGGCKLVGTTLAALSGGKATPYGGANAPFDLRVDHGEVVSLVEIYLP
jgi:hypothetical protein